MGRHLYACSSWWTEGVTAVTVIRVSIALLVVFGAISFCFGDPVGLIQPKVSRSVQEALDLSISDAENLEFAIGTLRQRDQQYGDLNHFEVARRFESPRRRLLREVEQLRNGDAILDDFRPGKIDFVFEFEKVYRANPYLEAMEMELYALDLKAAEAENIRRLAASEAPHSERKNDEAISPFRRVSFPNKQAGENRTDDGNQ